MLEVSGLLSIGLDGDRTLLGCRLGPRLRGRGRPFLCLLFLRSEVLFVIFAQRFLEIDQLPLKPKVGAGNRPLSANVLQSLHEGHVLFLHQVGDNDCGRTGYTGITVHKHLASVGKCLADEADGLLEVDRYVGKGHVKNVDNLVDELRGVRWLECRCYLQYVRDALVT